MNNSSKPRQIDIIKFAIMSVIGVFLFMVPLPHGDSFNIPLGIALNWLGGTINSVSVNGFGLLVLIACLMVTVSLLGTILAYVVKPAFIMENDGLKRLFLSSPVYFVSKVVAVIVAWLVFVDIGPDWLIGWDGGSLMLLELIADNGGLIAIFLVVGLAIPILTDFGLMEFLGILIRKVVRVLFTLPGRSSIDLFGSWFSSSAAGVIITRDQHEKGFYTHREAAAICVNFTLVSLPFTFVVASRLELGGSFALFYLVICVTAILLAVVMPRIWPLRGMKDEYLPEVGKQIDENVPEDVSTLSWAVNLAGNRANKTGATQVIKSGLSNWLSIFMDLIPVILAWGTIALIIQNQTEIFNWLSWPFARLLELLRVQEAATYAPATIVGFIDMFVPAILLSSNFYLVSCEYAGYALCEYFGTEGYEGCVRVLTAPLETRFILGALSIVQIIYLAETGILILKSKIPLNIGHLIIIFLMRTVFALPIIVLLTRLLFNV